MRSRALVIASLLAALLLAGAGAVYAYDRSTVGKIADGVRVGRLDVGGLTGEQARAKLRRAVLEPLSRPVRVRSQGRTYTLTSHQARVGVDLDGSVRAALASSREGNILARTVRTLSGGEVEADVELPIDYSKASVERLARRVRKAVDQPAVDASVDLDHGEVTPRPSKDGRRLLVARLKRDVRRQLLELGPREPIRARTTIVEPKVSTDQLAQKYPAILIVDRSAFKLTLYKNLKPAKTYSIAVGKVGMDTPAGLYAIQNKAENPAWHVPDSKWAGDLAGKVIPGGVPENPIKARWMGIYDGAGIHGTDADSSIGTAASHGCIRMRIPEVIELYDEVPVNAPVYIS